MGQDDGNVFIEQGDRRPASPEEALQDPVMLAADCHLHLLEYESVVFSEMRQQLFLLNTAATFIWFHFEEGKTIDAVLRAMCSDLGMELTEARQHLQKTLLAWRAQGLLSASESVPKKAPRGYREKKCADEIAADCGPRDAFFCRDYRLLQRIVRVRYTSDDQILWCHPILAHLDHDPNETPTPAATVDILEDAGKFRIFVDGKFREHVASITSLGPQVKGAVIVAAINLHSYILNIHAGVVTNGQSALLLPAAAGSGKSTLTAALVHSGYGYLSDETALLEMPNFHVHPFPIALCTKPGSWPVLRSLFPENDRQITHQRVDGKKVRYLSPPGSLKTAEYRPYSISHIVFPRYTPEMGTEMVPVSRATALAMLLDECVSIPLWLDKKTVAALVNWISSLQCYELRFSSLGKSVSGISSVFGPPY